MTAPDGGLRVLVADAEAPSREELAFLLGQQPGVAQVRSVASGAEVLLALEEETVDALVLDVRMPGLDGLDLARVLARFRTPPRVVFVTAYDEHAVEAFDLRAADYLLKPVRPERLIAHGLGISRNEIAHRVKIDIPLNRRTNLNFSFVLVWSVQ